MKIFCAALMISCFLASTCFSEGMKRYDAVAEDLSQKVQIFSEPLKKTGSVDLGASRRDPLQSLVDAQGNILETAGPKSAVLVLKGIVGSADSKTVLINDKFYAQGDSVDGYRILEIRPDGVVVQNDKDKVFVPLYPDTSTN